MCFFVTSKNSDAQHDYYSSTNKNLQQGKYVQSNGREKYKEIPLQDALRAIYTPPRDHIPIHEHLDDIPAPDNRVPASPNYINPLQYFYATNGHQGGKYFYKYEQKPRYLSHHIPISFSNNLPVQHSDYQNYYFPSKINQEYNDIFVDNTVRPHHIKTTIKKKYYNKGSSNNLNPIQKSYALLNYMFGDLLERK